MADDVESDKSSESERGDEDNRSSVAPFKGSSSGTFDPLKSAQHNPQSIEESLRDSFMSSGQ